MIRTIIKKLLGIAGYSVIRGGNRPFYLDHGYSLGYDYEEEAEKQIKIIRKNTMLPYSNLLTLFEQALFCEKNEIEGDYVECGVWKGGAIGLMALVNLHYGKTRRNIHLFDAFEEICAPDESIDGKKAIEEVKSLMGKNAKVSGELISLKGVYDKFGGPGTIEENKKLFEETIHYPTGNIVYHKGWFQDTVPQSSRTIEKIAILRLDGDWYASTKVCLDNLYDKVVIGGIIIIDDYGSYEGCKKAVDAFISNRKIKTFINYSSMHCRYWIKN